MSLRFYIKKLIATILLANNVSCANLNKYYQICNVNLYNVADFIHIILLLHV